MKRLGVLSSVIISVLMLARCALAQDFDKGLEAYNAGEYATAVQEWRPLAERGDARAQTLVGIMYENGRGVPQNDAQAVKWYQLAAEQGYAFARYNLGGMYKNGRGVPQDYTEAVRLYRLSAEQGHALAQTNLGVLYVSGFGVQQDSVLAHMWFNLGAANGNEFGAENRESIAREMTSQEIEKAQALARTCMANEYKNCGY